jgi:hypothetical protein
MLLASGVQQLFDLICSSAFDLELSQSPITHKVWRVDDGVYANFSFFSWLSSIQLGNTFS